MIEPISVDLDSLNLSTLSPMLIAIVGALVILCIDLFKKNLSKTLYIILSILFIFIDLGAVLGFAGDERGFFNVMLVDGISVLSQAIVLVASALFIPLALTTKRFHEFSYPEFFSLFLFMTAGFQFMVSSDNLILIFVGLETASLALYTLIAMHNREKAIEAAIKYFTMGALAAGLYTFGAMILYALTGSIELEQIATVLASKNFEPITFVTLAFVMMFAALAFKLSIVPFHTWTPDVYEGSNANLAGYMSVVPKLAGFVVAIRIFGMFIDNGAEFVQDILLLASVITLTVANISALVQKDVKRMLAFSSISHAGSILAAILVSSEQSISSIFLYWTLFLFTNLGAFTMLWISTPSKSCWESGSLDYPFEKFSGLIKTMPMAAIMMALFMLSLAGLPPFSIFWGKMYLIGSIINEGYVGLAIIMVLNSAVAGYYYLKLIVHMFLKEPNLEISDDASHIQHASTSLKVIIGFSATIIISSIFYVNPLLDIISIYIN